MYLPTRYQIDEAEPIHALIKAHPLATLISRVDDDMEANHLPMMFVPTPGPHGVLQCHVARSNPLWNTLATSPRVLIVFTGVDGYMSPNWYATKAVHGKVVPTWNYEAVHVQGVAKIRDDETWLRGFLDSITAQHEATQHRAWKLSDAPEDFIHSMMKAIVGIEVTISSMQGKAKLSQNQPSANLPTILAGLRASPPESVGASTMMKQIEMANKIEAQRDRSELRSDIEPT